MNFRLALNSGRSSGLSLPSAAITSVCHHGRLRDAALRRTADPRGRRLLPRTKPAPESVPRDSRRARAGTHRTRVPAAAEGTEDRAASRTPRRTRPRGPRHSHFRPAPTSLCAPLTTPGSRRLPHFPAAPGGHRATMAGRPAHCGRPRSGTRGEGARELRSRENAGGCLIG